MRRVHPLTRFLLLLLLLSAGTAASLRADVLIEPSVLFLSDGTRARTFSVVSREKGPVVVTLRIRTGYAGTSAAAEVKTERSVVAYLSLSDSSFVLAPGEKRTITCQAAVPAALSQGEYWARILVHWAHGTSAAESGTPADAPAGVVGVVYRKGEAFADVKLVSAGGTRDADAVRFYVDLVPLGNAAYRGNMIVDITGKKNKVVYSARQTVDVYDRQRQVFEIDGSAMPPGMYHAVLRFNTEREDLGKEALPVLPKEYKIDFNMP